MKNPDVPSKDATRLSPLYLFSSIHDADRDAGDFGLLHMSAGSLLTSVSPSEAKEGPKMRQL